MDENTARARHPDSMRQAFLWALLPILLLVLTPPNGTYAQVVTNITPSLLPACPSCGPQSGPTTVSPVSLAPLPGNTYNITGGARPGNGPNLFHSFGQFNVGTGDVANFQNTQVNGAFPATSNILSRVTGGNPSQIYGTIRTTDFGSANLFLMNPAGVLFGPTAVLDLGAVSGPAARDPGGSFYATTADYLKLVDAAGTSYFYANPATTSVLSVAPVAAFGFTSSNPVSITLEGSNLAVGQGKTLAFIGGNAPFLKTVSEAPLVEEPVPSGVTVTGGSLTAPGGQIQLASIASAQEASPTEVSIADLSVTIVHPSVKNQAAVLGPIALTGTVLDVSGQSEFDAAGNPIGGNSGTVFVRGGQLVMDASFIFAITVGPVDGAPTAVDIQVSQDVALTNGALILTETSGPGRGGDVHITADSLTLDNASTIATLTLFGDGVGGDLFLNVGKKLSLLGGSLIQSTTFNDGTDLDGDGVVDVIHSKGGNVTVQGALQGAESVAEKVVLSGGSQINSETDASGPGGKISITATSIDMDEGAAITTSTFGTGLGGNVEFGVQQLSMIGGAQVRSHTDSGDPTAAAGGTVLVHGLQGAESKADSLTISGPDSGIIANTFGNARLGDLVVHAKTVSLTDEAVIQAGTPFDTGSGGNVTIDADSIGISGGSSITSQAYAVDAGQVTITANNELTLDNGSIVTKSFEGIGGNVVLNVGTVSLTNGASIDSKTISANRAGDITMNIGTLTLTNKAEISSNSGATATGDAGTVTIQGRGGAGTSATSVTLTNSSLLTNAEGAGAGGDITVAAASFTLNNASTVSAATAGPQNAGTITITTMGNPVSLASGSSITSATTGAGDAGQVIITTPALSLNDASITTSTSGTGDAGSITANVGTLSLTNAAEIASSSTGAATGAAGSVTIQGLASPAKTVTLTDSAILTRAEGTGAGGSIAIDATTLTLNNATISAAVTDVPVGGDPAAGVGNIALIAPTFQMTGGSISAATTGSRNAGNIALLATTFSADSGATITSSSTGTASGAAGSIILQGLASPAETVTLTDSAILTRAEGTGAGGSIAIGATTLTLNNATISAAVTDVPVGGDPAAGVGNIGLIAPTFQMTGGSISAATTGSRNAGSIALLATTFSADSGATITSSSTGTASGAAGSIILQGLASPAETVTLTDSAILTRAEGTGAGGSIAIGATTLTLNNATISAAVTDVPVGGDPAAGVGDIALTSSTMHMTGGTVTAETSGTRNAGTITVNATGGVVSLANGSRITSASTGTTAVPNPDGFTTEPPGTAGNVTITAAGSFTSDASSIATSAEANHGGDISITAHSVQLSGGTLITASSKAPLNVTKLVLKMDANGNPVLDTDGNPMLDTVRVGDGNAGNIAIHSGSTFVMNNSKVTTEASQASGGTIEITAPEMVRLINSRVSTSVGGLAGESDGGNIKIDPQFVVLQNSQILAQAFAGAGGAITITATSAFIADPASIVDASSTLGINGPVFINSPLQNIGGRLTPLSQKFSSAAALLAQRCAARAADGKFSTFVVAGREGLPAEPGGFLASPSLTAELLGSSLSGRDRPTQFPAVTGLFQEYDARPIQLAMYGNACR